MEGPFSGLNILRQSQEGTGPSGTQGGDSIADFQLPIEVQRELADLVQNVVSHELQKIRAQTQDAPGGSHTPSGGTKGNDKSPTDHIFPNRWGVRACSHTTKVKC